jgi:hypothetical protein
MEYSEEMILQSTNVEEVEEYGRFENDMIRLSIKLPEHIIRHIEQIGLAEFNNILHEERLDSYIEGNEIVDYFLDKEKEFNGDLSDDTKIILIGDAIDAMNQVLNKIGGM